MKHILVKSQTLKESQLLFLCLALDAQVNNRTAAVGRPGGTWV
jgi:hypothetical protein